MMAGLLSAIVDRLTLEFPRLALHIIEGDPPDLQDRHLRAGDIDLMIGRLPTAVPVPGTDVHVLLHETGAVVAGSGNSWVRRRKIRLADLIDEPWCLPPPESFPGSWIAKAFRAHGLDVPKARVSVYSIQMLLALCATERFLAVLPSTMLHFSARRLSLKALPVDLRSPMWPIGIVTLKGRTPNPAARLFIECAQETAKPLKNKRN